MSACEALIPPKLPDDPPPLKAMEEPLALFQEPDDEADRLKLPFGGFTGLVVAAAWRSLEEEEEGNGVVVTKVVENSPADVAGLQEGDVLLAAYDAKSREHLFSWPSQWRSLELEARADDEIKVVFDRAGVEMEASIKVIPRVRAPGRQAVERFRDEGRVGVILRTATEVEARGNGLGPGGGAVIVGLSKDSPWRRVGLRYEDMIVSIAGRPVEHPQVVLDAIRAGGDAVPMEIIRGGERLVREVPLSSREWEMTHFDIPLLFSYERDRGETQLSFFFYLFLYRSTPAASEWRFLWFFWIRSGDAGRLEEVKAP